MEPKELTLGTVELVVQAAAVNVYLAQVLAVLEHQAKVMQAAMPILLLEVTQVQAAAVPG